MHITTTPTTPTIAITITSITGKCPESRNRREVSRVEELSRAKKQPYVTDLTDYGSTAIEFSHQTLTGTITIIFFFFYLHFYFRAGDLLLFFPSTCTSLLLMVLSFSSLFRVSFSQSLLLLIPLLPPVLTLYLLVLLHLLCLVNVSLILSIKRSYIYTQRVDIIPNMPKAINNTMTFGSTYREVISRDQHISFAFITSK